MADDVRPFGGLDLRQIIGGSNHSNNNNQNNTNSKVDIERSRQTDTAEFLSEALKSLDLQQQTSISSSPATISSSTLPSSSLGIGPNAAAGRNVFHKSHGSFYSGITSTTTSTAATNSNIQHNSLLGSWNASSMMFWNNQDSSNCLGMSHPATVAATRPLSSSSSSSALLTPRQIFGNQQHLITSDTLIARLVNQLTAREREQVMLEIHGVADTIDESQPFLVATALKAMGDEITRIRLHYAVSSSSVGAVVPSSSSAVAPNSGPTTTTTTTPSSFNGDRRSGGGGTGGTGRGGIQLPFRGLNVSSYEKALNRDPLWVRSPELCVKFLRAEKFQPELAAVRMIRYFEEKERLFGEDSLCQPKVFLKDLSPRAIEILELGAWQLLPGRDQSGRAIFVCAGKLIQFRTDPDDILAALQAFWKMSEITVDDETTQKRGCVLIVYTLGAGPNSGAELRGLQRIGRASPIRTSAIHACIDDATTKMVFDLSILMTGADESRRYRCHVGSDVEVQYCLSTFGIPTRLLPVGHDGSIDKSQFMTFLKDLRALEDAEIDALEKIKSMRLGTTPMNDQVSNAQSSRSSTTTSARFSDAKGPEYVVVPSDLDVLLGRGRSIQEHAGNVRCRQLVASYRDSYDQGSKGEKTSIIKMVVDGVHEWGGRFLERSEDGALWFPVPDDHARYKISHGFRNHKRLATQKRETVKGGDQSATAETGVSTTSVSGRKSPSQKRTAGARSSPPLAGQSARVQELNGTIKKQRMD